MKAIAVNGSPRKSWNTAILLQHALQGAKSFGAETELIHLYDYNFRGCYSCFACKRKGSKNFGRCVIHDDLLPLWDKIESSDMLFIGSPIYYGAVTGETRSFLERFMFQYMQYSTPPSSVFPGKLKVGFIYTMNINEQQFHGSPLKMHTEKNESNLQLIFGNIEIIHSFDTYQVDDYSNIEYTYLNAEQKRKRRISEFPHDCQKAFDMGVRFSKSFL